MYNFNFHSPGTLDEAINLYNNSEDPKFLAGGMTLIPTLKQRLASPDGLIDISGCKLDSISDEGETLRIGAMSRHVSVAESAVVQKAIPALAKLAEGIGDRQVRNRGTIGGSVANNDPSACYPSAVLALKATVNTNNRSLAADDFFTGMFETALEEDEIIESISFSKPRNANYIKFPNPASRYAMVGVFVAQFDDGVRVAVTGAGEGGVFRHKEMETALSSNFSAEALSSINIASDGLISDLHASSEYRANLIKEMTKRAVA